MTSSSSDFASANPVRNEPSPTDAPARSSNQSEGILAGAKQETSSLAGGTSATEIKDNVASVAGKKMTGVKQTVVDDAMPAAAGALQTAQDKIRGLTGGNPVRDSGKG